MDEAVAAVLSLMVVSSCGAWGFWYWQRAKTRQKLAEAEARAWEAKRDMTEGPHA